MGMFSWITSDTNESITNVFSSKGSLPCKMLLPDGSEYEEFEYEGYGVFCGYDFYDAVVDINNLEVPEGEEKRIIGIDAACGDDAYKLLLPKLVSIGCNKSYRELPDSKDCPNQGS